MTFDQTAILLLLLAMLAVFALDRFRLEVVSLVGLAIGLLLGLVPSSRVFVGFSDPAVITVAEILLIVQVLSRTPLLGRFASYLVAVRFGERATIGILCAAAATISVFMNNIGALALMLPVIYSVCAAASIPPRHVLMPVSFATLLGGICSVIGTPANLIASDQLVAATGTGHGFALFDFAWAGIPAAIAGLAAMLIALPRHRFEEEDTEVPPRENRKLVAPLRVPGSSTLIGQPLTDLHFLVHSLLRDGRQVFLASRDTALREGDIGLVGIDEQGLDSLVASGDLEPEGKADPADASVQAVIMPGSTVVGSRIGNLHAYSSRGVRVAAASPRSARIEGTFEDIQLSVGDLLYLEGSAARIGEAIAETEMLAVAGQEPHRSESGGSFGLIVFLAGILLAATSIVSPPVAFGAVVLVLAALGALDLRVGLTSLNWPILIMLAAMIPLGNAVETTGLAKVLADALAGAVPQGSPLWLSAAMLVLAVLVTPFVNNASTVIVLGPIAVQLAIAAGIAPQPLLIAVAMGASIDFLTPFGHHNNTLVMGLGNYRFSEFPRVGWIATLAAGLTGLLFINLFWG